MRSPGSAVRGLGAVAALACLAALAAACGSTSGTAASPAATAGATPIPSSPQAGAAAPASSPPATSASPPATAAATPSGAPPCATSALKVTVSTSHAGAAAGSAYYPIDFTNASSASCTLYGYPGVSFVTGVGGSQIGIPATENANQPRQVITLAPGQTGHAELQVVDAANYPPADCGMVTAHWLKVYPPNQTAPTYASFTSNACSKPRTILTVQTVQAGTSGM
jgi:hypothetical protein